MKPVEEWSSEDHQAALARIDQLMDAADGTPEAEELTRLAIMVSSYERVRFPSHKRSLVQRLQDFLRGFRGLKPWE